MVAPRRKKQRTGADTVASGQQQRQEELDVSCDKLREAAEASVQAIQAARVKAEEECARMLNEAKTAAAKIMEEANTVKAETERYCREAREALEREKTAMEKAHTFQKNHIKLNVGGHRFETSLQTLTSVPDTYFASMFSGRFELTPLTSSSEYFIDRCGSVFHHVLDYMRDPASFDASCSDLTETEKKKLEVEAKFYGMFDRMFPHLAQEKIGREEIGRSLLERACLDGSEDAIRKAVAQARALVFEMGSTTPFLEEKFQDLRYVMTDRVVNGSPVWAAVDGENFMYRDVGNFMVVSDESSCIEGDDSPGHLYNWEVSSTVGAPTDLPSDEWVSSKLATLESKFSSAAFVPKGIDREPAWAHVPSMRITVVHGLDDDDPMMAKALQMLASLA